MRFKFKSFLFALIGVVSIATTTAFSYFVFDDISNSNAIIEEDIKVDNIEENYIFGRNENKFTEYTIYLFPSTLYLKIYEDYLKGNTQTLPEDAFGYIEGKENIEGGVDYETHFSSVGYGNYKDYTSYINSNELYLDEQKVDVTERFFIKTSANHYDIVYDIEKTLREKNGLGLQKRLLLDKILVQAMDLKVRKIMMLLYLLKNLYYGKMSML